MSIYDMEAHIERLEKENRELKARFPQPQPDFTPYHNGNGFEAAEPDETMEDTAFRLLIENGVFEGMNPDDRESFLLLIAQNCINWALNRRDY